MKLNTPLKMPKINISFDYFQRFKNKRIKRKLPKTVVAVDIGTFALKLVEMQLGKNKMIKKIIYYPWQQPAPDRDVLDLIQHPDFSKQLEYILKTNNINNRNFYVAAASNKIVMRPFTFPPNMPNYEINQLLNLQLEDQIPYSSSEVYYDYTVVKKDDNETYVQVFASDRVYIDTIIDVFSSLKCNLYCINVSPAMLKVAVGDTDQSELSEMDLLVVVNMGASTTELNIFCGNELLLFRTIPLGGNDFTNAFMQAGNLEFDIAEHTKCLTGLNMAVQMDPVIGVQNELFDQIWRSIQYVIARNHSYRLRKVLLTGGSAVLKGFDGKLRRYIEVQTRETSGTSSFDIQIVNPFLEMKFAKDIDVSLFNEVAASFVTVIGLANGGV